MANNNRTLIGQESVEEKTRKYTRPHPIVTSQLRNLQQSLFAKPQWGVSPVMKHERNITPLMNTPIIVSPQVSVNYGNRKRRSDFNNDSTDYGKRKRVVPDNRYSELTREVEDYATNNRQRNTLLEKKLKLRNALLLIFRRQFPQSSLFLVGSSCNGFATNTSDADFCLMLTDGSVDQRFEACHYLRAMQKMLRSCGFAKKIIFIRAKVPILKFQDAVSGCECDININNSVGIRNTHLLRTYSKVDDRIQPLAMTVKRWAKERSINDASQGTLSSYSLMLMVLHFLQSACRPPVLTSLQQEYPHLFDARKPVNELPMFEPADIMPCNSSENQQSVGELLEQFFRYYAYDFNYDFLAISVRLGRAIPKHLQPEWSGKFICVEEPFELTNTARAVYDLGKFMRIKEEFKRAAKRLEEKLSIDNIL